MGLCPVHGERKGSFVVYEDGHFQCFSAGCGIHGNNLVGLVYYTECNQSWPEAFRRAEEIIGEPIGERRNNTQREKPVSPKIVPLPEQQHMLGTFMRWSHEQLFEGEGKPARDYLTKRGINPELFSDQTQLGFIPGNPGAVLSLFKILSEEAYISLHEVSWQNLAYSVGILRDKGSLRLKNRILCFCIGHTRFDNPIMFYQGRILGDDQLDTRCKYLNPPFFDKHPFTLLVEPDKRRLEGTCIVEGAFEVLALYQHGIQAVAELGTSHRDFPFASFNPPYYVCHNHDAPTMTRSGWVRPGDVAAERILRQASEKGLEAYRMRPPLEHKDIDRWLLREGIEPFLREIEHATTKGNSYEEVEESVYVRKNLCSECPCEQGCVRPVRSRSEDRR